MAEQDTILRGNRDAEGTWFPFDITDDPNKPGVFVELTPLLFERAGIKYVYSHLPTKRAVKALHEGRLDFDFVNPQWLSTEDAQPFVFSEPLFQITEYFITLAKTLNQYQHPDDVYGKRVGTVAGYYYYDDQEFHRVDFRSESEVILGLKKNRFQVAIMEQFAAVYWAQNHRVDLAFGAIHTQGNMVMRIRKEFSYLLPRINKAILTLRNEGKIQQIVNHYTQSNSFKRGG